MGMFDTVKLECPGCHESTEVQSKAGPREMNMYVFHTAPAEVLLDLSTKEIRCVNCNAPLKVKFHYMATVEVVTENLWRTT